MEPQFITDREGKRLSVILPVEDYEKLVEAMEELEDIRLFNEAKTDSTDSFEEYLNSRQDHK